MNKLAINSNKTKVMLFSRAAVSNRPHLSLSINNVPSEQVRDYKYLGFRLDDRLHPKVLLNEVIRTVQPKVYLLSKIRSSITSRTALIIYK